MMKNDILVICIGDSIESRTLLIKEPADSTVLIQITNVHGGSCRLSL